MSTSSSALDAIVIGAGPNGLVAAATLAGAGWRVTVLEAQPTVGGGTRSADLTLPGYVHDVCSAIHPLGVGSPVMRELPLETHGLRWIHPDAPVAHPLDGGRAAVLERSVDATAVSLGDDGAAYLRLMTPLVRHALEISDAVLSPLSVPPLRSLASLARFGASAVWPAERWARHRFRTDEAQGLIAGLASHAFAPLTDPTTAAYGLLLGMLAHAVGWPMAEGGSQAIADALVSLVRERGGEIVVDSPVTSLAELPPAAAILCDLTPRQLLDLGGDRLPARYRRALSRYRYGPGVWKVDWALDGPIPWTAPGCRRAGTVHLGGTMTELAHAASEVDAGRNPERPYVLVAQQSLFDESRVPPGGQSAWAYCHVPNGSTVDVTDRIEAQVERFAPGFRDRIAARHVMGPMAMHDHNANYIGGDISGGSMGVRQLITRPVVSFSPWRTPVPGLYLCSSSTPPGPGVHGMCGLHAAEAAMHDHPDLGQASDVAAHAESGEDHR